MTDWRDIVKMVEAFSEVFRIRRCQLDTSYPPVPTAINPRQRKQSRISTEQPPLKAFSEVTDRIDEPSAGYTGELGSSGDDGLSGEPASLQWRNVWPE
jgi:hypothetical protein